MSTSETRQQPTSHYRATVSSTEEAERAGTLAACRTNHTSPPSAVLQAMNSSVSLADVCYKPFGDSCATQSVLQYWRMNRTLYESGLPPYHTKLSPQFCFEHWSTQVLLHQCGGGKNERSGEGIDC